MGGKKQTEKEWTFGPCSGRSKYSSIDSHRGSNGKYKDTVDVSMTDGKTAAHCFHTMLLSPCCNSTVTFRLLRVWLTSCEQAKWLQAPKHRNTLTVKYSEFRQAPNKQVHHTEQTEKPLLSLPCHWHSTTVSKHTPSNTHTRRQSVKQLKYSATGSISTFLWLLLCRGQLPPQALNHNIPTHLKWSTVNIHLWYHIYLQEGESFSEEPSLDLSGEN